MADRVQERQLAGGVDPAVRGSGVAGRLMRHRHRWLERQGCSPVETAADHGNVAMARIGLQEGFAVCGLRAERGRLQVPSPKVRR